MQATVHGGHVCNQYNGAAAWAASSSTQRTEEWRMQYERYNHHHVRYMNHDHSLTLERDRVSPTVENKCVQECMGIL